LNIISGLDHALGEDLWPSSRFTQETEEKNFLSLAYEGERLEQFLYRNVLIEVTAILWAAQEGMIFYMVKLRQ
jgi:hypothetical protein